MRDIVCPNCNTTFQVDESVYAAILSQVRTREFNEEVERRLADIAKQHASSEEALKLRVEREYEARLAKKNDEISALKSESAKLKGELEAFDSRKKADLIALEASKDKELSATLNVCKTEIHEKDRRILELEASIKASKLAAESRVHQLEDYHRQQLLVKQEEIDRLKDFKLRLSTKMLGETLEQHCFIEFNRAKSFGQFPEATFEKDNTVAEGTKGDFIFRDFVDGDECVSIMFEMKNEADATAAKHKNEHFFEKLHKDREKKGCEFAVLVSMLEQGNELYDAGIVDMSYRYPKMIVIRPQFFLPVLRLISEGARKGHLKNRELLAELETARNESRDFSKFEEKINNFAKTFGNHVKGAHVKFVAANAGIDKIITNLEKQISMLREVKANFEASEQKLLKADTYVEENLTVKKLTHGAPSVKKMIMDAAKEED